MEATAIVEDEVRELVRRRALDPAADAAAVRRLTEEVVAEYDERSLTGRLPALVDRTATVRAVVDAVAGYGPLQVHLDDPEVEEIWTNQRLTAGWSALMRWLSCRGPVRDGGEVPAWILVVVMAAGIAVAAATAIGPVDLGELQESVLGP